MNLSLKPNDSTRKYLQYNNAWLPCNISGCGICAREHPFALLIELEK